MKPLVTATHAVFVEHKGHHAPAAVVGLQIQHASLSSHFQNITSTVSMPSAILIATVIASESQHSGEFLLLNFELRGVVNKFRTEFFALVRSVVTTPADRGIIPRISWASVLKASFLCVSCVTQL